MSNLETLETVEAYSEPLNSVALLAGQEEEQSEPWSLSISLRKAVKRFVAWIDGVDVDGQQYWS